jgi:putative methionine-R-sulfoxide reductase with GAF domain
MCTPLTLDLNTLNHEEALQFVARFQVLLEINSSINSTIELDVLLRTIIDVAKMVVNAEASSLALLDRNSQELVFHFAAGAAGQKIEQMRIPAETGIAGYVAQTGEALIVPDVRQDPRFFSGADQASQFETRSMICVPLARSGNQIMGVLQVINKKNGQFDETDRILFSSLANIAAIAIENSQLYHLLQQTLEKVREDNQRLNMILEKLESSEAEVRQMKTLMAADQSGAVRGSLAVIIPPNILQMLANDAKSGCVTINSNPQSGKIYLSKGEIHHAETEGTPPFLTGPMAIYEMMGWTDGSFSFNAEELPPARTITQSCMQLIIEGLRRSDELKLLQAEFPDALSVLVRGDAPQADDPELEVCLRVLRVGQTVAEARRRAPVDSHTFYSALRQFCRTGLVTLGAA